MSKKIDQESASFFKDVWANSRDLLVHIVADAFIAISLWFFLWVFKSFTIYFQIDHWVGKVINELHSIGAVLAFAIFFILSIMDIIKSRKNGG